MSYCRWSTDDFQCDLYVYENVSGFWSIHVASNRPVYHQPLPEWIPLTAENVEAWAARSRLVMDWLDDETKSHREPIDLPHAGETFAPDTPGEAADILTMLKEAGYRFPYDIIEELREEQQELDKEEA